MEKKTFRNSWRVENPRGTIIIIHGLGEHILRYEELAEFFNSKRYDVVGFDHYGHGQSSGKRGHIGSYNDTYNQIDDLVMEASSDRAIFLYGHSFGGNMLLNYTIDHIPQISGIIVSAPFITMGKPTPKLLVFFGQIMSRIFPSFQIENGLELDNLSTNPKIIEDYKADPLVHSKVSARLAANMIKNAKRLVKYRGTLSAPVLFMHGEKDIITGPNGTKKFAEKLFSNGSIKIWKNEFHEIHNGVRKEEVWNHTLSWIHMNH